MRPFDRPSDFRSRWILIAILLLCGCANRVELDLCPVAGRVTLDGKPLPRGSVSLRAEGSSQVWQQPTGLIGKDGEFVIYTQGQAGAPPGRYRAVVFAAEEIQADGAHPGLPRSLVPERYADPQRTPLWIEVQREPDDDQYHLELTSHEA